MRISRSRREITKTYRKQTKRGGTLTDSLLIDAVKLARADGRGEAADIIADYAIWIQSKQIEALREAQRQERQAERASDHGAPGAPGQVVQTIQVQGPDDAVQERGTVPTEDRETTSGGDEVQGGHQVPRDDGQATEPAKKAAQATRRTARTRKSRKASGGEHEAHDIDDGRSHDAVDTGKVD